MSVSHRICDALDCIEIEKGRYSKAKKESDEALNRLTRYQHDLIILLLKELNEYEKQCES
jgi:hypothetical protein